MAQEWQDFIASSPERAVRYTHTPQFFRRQYFDTVVKPKFTGAPADLEAVWEDFNRRADTADQKILEPEMYQRAQVNRRQKPVGNPVPYSDFLATHLDGEGGFTAEEYKNNAVVRGIVRGAYFEHVIQPRVPLTQDIGPIREDYNRRTNEADKDMGLIEAVGYDKQTQARKSGLPSLTPANLSEAPKDGSLLDSVAKDAARTLQLDPGEASPRERQNAVRERKKAVRERYTARLQAEGKPQEVIDRLMFIPAPARTLEEITRDNLLDRMVAGGTPAIDAAQILDSPEGQKVLAESRKAAIQYGAEMAKQGDVTWTRLWQDFKANANRNIMDTAKNRVWAAAALDVDPTQELPRVALAKRLGAAADDYTAQLPEPLVGRGFWGQGVVDVGGMAPLMIESIAATMVGGPAAGTAVFASDQIGRHYRYAVEEAGLAPGMATRLAAISGGVLHASLEQASLNLARTPFGKSGLLAKAIDKATLKYTTAVARRPIVQGAVNFTANTAEQILQEGAQQAVEVLHNEFANYRGGKGFDISQLKSQVMDAMKQAAAPSILVGAFLGAPSGVRVAGLSRLESQIDAAEAELKAAGAEQRSAVQEKLDQWNTRASELRQSLGWESPQADAPQTTTGGPLDAPAAEAPQAPEPQQQTPPPTQSFTIGDQQAFPGMVLEGPQGLVTVEQIVPDPETTEKVVIVRTAAGEEMVLGTAELAAGNYKPATQEAPAPEPVAPEVVEPPAPVAQEEPPVAEAQAAPEPAPVVAEVAPPEKPKPRKPKAASKPAVTTPAAPAKAPEPEAAKPEPEKVEPAAEAPKVEAAAASPLVGRKWRTPFSGTIPQKVVEAEVVAVLDGYAFVKTDPNSKGAERIKLEDLDARIAKEEAATAKFEAAKPAQAEREAKAAAEEQAKADKLQQVDAFLADNNPMQAGKRRKVLTVGRSFNGKSMTVHEMVEEMVAKGAKVVSHPEDKRRLQRPNGAFFTQGQTTSTGMDYAEFLIGQKPKAPAEAAKSALSTGTYETAKPELVALGKQVVADGHDTLPKFTKRIKELLGDTYAKLKGKIGDLWKAVQEDRGSFRMGEVLRPKVRSKARQAGRRWLVTGGAMPDWMFELDLARKGWMAAQGKMIEMRTNVAIKALEKQYGTLTAENMLPINAVLAGEVDAMTLPEAVRGPVTAMRDAITHLQDQLLKSGMLDEKMSAVIEGSKGVYLTRTYRVFDDPKFYDQTLRAIQELQGDPARLKVVKEALRFVQAAYYIPEDLSAVSWPELLRLGSKRGIAVKGRPKADILADLEALVESKGREVSLAEAQNMLADFLSVASPVKGEVKTATAFAQGDIVGTMDLRSFMRRGNVPVELRELLGENKDPILNFTTSSLRIAQMVANHKFLTSVAEVGKRQGVFFTKEQARVGIADPLSPDRITTANEQFPDTPGLAPLAGLYTNAEIKRAMMDAVTPVEMSKALRVFLGINALVKIGKTGYSVIATTRNFTGNSIIAMMGGHYRLSKFGDARAVAWSAFVADGSKAAEVKRLVELGIIGSSASAGEMQAVMEEAHLRGSGDQALYDVLFERQIAAVKAGHGKVMGFYQLMDDIWKVYAFYNEHATYEPVARKKGWTPAQLDTHVAGIVRDITPTYAMQPAWVKAFRRWPFQGTFISFPYAMWRVLFMSGRLAGKEMQDADTFWIGMRRAASLLSGILAPVLAVEANNLRLGITDEEDEWGRKFMAPYMRNGLIWWIEKPHMGKDGRVRLRYINLSFTLPTAVFLDPIMSIMRGARNDEFGKGMMQALVETLSPATSEEILAGAVLNIRDNEARSGKPIFNRQEMNDWQQVHRSATKIAKYFGQEVAPGFVSQGAELWMGYEKFVNLYGKKYDMVESAASIASGVRIMQSDLKSSLTFAMSRQHFDNTEATTILSDESNTVKRNPTEASLRAAAQSAEKSHQHIWVKTRELVEASRAFGLPERDIREAMLAAGMGKERVQNILAGRYYVWTPGNQFMSGLSDKIEASEGALRGRAEIRRRRMIIEKIARENAKTDFGILPGNVKPIWRRGE